MDTPAEWQPYIEAWRERWRRRQAEVEQRTALAREAAGRCAAYLAERWGVSRVYLFGSLAGWGKPHAHSDVDLAAEGLPPGGEYFRILADLWEYLPEGVELDLVPLEEAHPGLRERILSEGELLYERD
ncbi:MAG: nucleotidyltransferase family protein [Anaerolineae bacterium]